MAYKNKINKKINKGEFMVNVFGFIDIIIRREALEKKEKGLSNKLIDKYKLKDKFYDDKIICIPGGMNPFDAEREINELENTYGLVFNPDIHKDPETDIVIVKGLWGIQTKNKWLKEKREKLVDGFSIRYYYEETK